MSDGQPSLFEFEEPKPKRRPPNPDHARNKLIFMINLMRNATTWPWPEESLRFFRESMWPDCLAVLPDKEAAKFQSQIDAESARLDAAPRSV